MGAAGKPSTGSSASSSSGQLRAAPCSARGGVGCAGFNGRLSGFWQVAGSADAPTLTPLGGAGLKEYVTVHGALDQGATLGLALLAGPDNFNDEVSVIRPATVKDPRRVLHGTSFWDCDC